LWAQNRCMLVLVTSSGGKKEVAHYAAIFK
jgi:hypothetical protein